MSVGANAGLPDRRRQLLATLLREQQIKVSASERIPKRAAGSAMPLSYAQQRLWFLDQLSPGNSFYNIPVAIPIDTPIDTGVLQRCVDELVQRHETLRTSFDMLDGQPRQRVHERMQVEVRLIEVEGELAAERDEQVQRLATEEAVRPFDLGQGPLLRVRLLRLEPRRHLLLLTLHHIIADAWSIGVLWSELTTLYAAFAAGSASPLQELPIQYADFAIWQRDWLSGEVREKQIAYWRQRLQELPTLALPTDRVRPTIQSFRGDHVVVKLDATLTRALGMLSQQVEATLFMTVLAGFKALLMRYSGQTDVVVGAPIAGRDRAQLEGLIGFFVNTLVLRTDLGSDPSVLELIGLVRETALGGFAHAELPFEMLVEELQPQRDLSRNPLFQVTFQLFAASGAQEGSAKVPPVDVKRGTAPFDLSLSLWESAAGLQGVIEYSTDLYERASMVRLAGHLQTLLAGMVAQPQAKLSQLPLLTPGERRQLLVEWNATQAEYPQQCLHELVQAQARRDPEAVAVVFGEEQLSYGELEWRANQVAHWLHENGVQAETLVGLCVERSLEMVVGLLGILKAGGAYVPLDPQYPTERLRYMLEDANVALLLTQQALAPRIPKGNAKHLLLDQEWAQVAALPGDMPPPSESTPDNLAYVIYTSGSTGTPKGVMVPHRGLANVVQEQRRLFGLTPQSRVLQFAPLSFDASVFEVVMALANGASLYLACYEVLVSPSELMEFLAEHEISIVTLPPSFLAAQPVQDLPALETITVAGEPCPAELPLRWLRAGRRFFNLYGPTEDTIWTTCADCTDATTRPAIGRPIANTQVYVLDTQLQPVPCGVAGELYIGGVGLARGYLGRPQMTAERFIAHPFNNKAGERLYRTGDLVRYRADGQLEFLGRIDHQVKLRGFRIDLGEIEAVLAQHPAVAQVVAVMREDTPGRPHLVAYVLAQRGLVINTSELRRFMRERVPDYMLPTAWGVLEQWPVTPNGKIDRDALPQVNAQAEASYVAPRTPLERVLAQLWADALGIERVGVHDNFFELGGDSILSIQFMARANQTGLRLATKDVFEHQTIAQLALAVGQGQAHAEQGAMEGMVPLTPIQRWFFECRLDEPHHFNQAVLLPLESEPDAHAMNHALEELLRHHDALRMRFDRNADEAWVMDFEDAVGQPFFERHDLSTMTPRARRKAIQAHSTRLQASLNLSEGPLLRAALFDAGQDTSSRLLIVVHHLVVDGMSWRILLEDMQTAYDQLARGGKPRLPAKTSSFQQWSRKLLDHAGLNATNAEARYWLELVPSGCPSLPVDHKGVANAVAQSSNVSVSLSVAQTEALLHELPKRHRTGINDVLLTAVVQAFAPWTGRRSLLVDVEGHGREPIFDDIDLSRTVGWFTSFFPVHLDIGKASTTVAALKAVKEQLRTIPNRGISFGIARYLGPHDELRDAMRKLPRPEVVFNYFGMVSRAGVVDSATDDELMLGGLPVSPKNQRQHLIEINARVVSGRMEAKWTFATQVHFKTTIESLAQRFIGALQELIEADGTAAAGSLMPSDFPQARASQDDLEVLVRRISKTRPNDC